ncbi:MULTISPECIES: hypothetical protein [Streptomyces]|uniref:hypothetical protein n=1 Tax=Streptomyces TaxID=1883 RepID=UPI0004BF7F2F|nr:MULTISPECIES: hypothetical protein [Streptomyces]GHJ21605.1 hypothetical protein TPA0909_32190 [Streptomyces albus]
MLRLWLYGTVVPGVLGLVAMAAIVLPGDGDDLTYTRLFTGGGALIATCALGGYIGGRVAGRRL